MTWETVCWPRSRALDALHVVARHRAWRIEPATPQAPSAVGEGADAIASAATATGLEIEHVLIPRRRLSDSLSSLGAALIVLDEERIVVIVRSRASRIDLVTIDGEIVRLPISLVERLLHARPGGLPDDLARTLDRLPLSRRRRERARRLIAAEISRDESAGDIWIVKPRPEDASAAAREMRLTALGVLFVAGQLAQMMTVVASWWVLGMVAFYPTAVTSLFEVWVLLALSAVVLRCVSGVAGRHFAARLGTMLKSRLLAGALKLDLDEVRGKGVGAFLTHVLESNVLESSATTGAYGGVTALIAMIAAAAILTTGAGGVWHASLFIGWIAAMAIATHRYYRARKTWTGARFALTGHVVENMTGHKTRLAQKAPADRLDAEDQLLAAHLDAEAALNRWALAIDALRRAWSWTGFLALAPILVNGTASAPSLVVSVGGVLLGSLALAAWADSSAQLSAALVVWDRVASLWHAASRRRAPGSAWSERLLAGGGGVAADQPLLSAEGVTYRHPNRDRATLENVRCSIAAGERVRLSGVSGSGKSTLAAVLSGEREPQAGLLFLGGLDRATVGADRWRQRVVLTTQFHTNHVFIGTMAYNLLMGRRWPPASSDLDAAYDVCGKLGLQPLIDRMPLGMHQPVGESGWQLSHGEQARLFVARALLQNPLLIILDEAFGALDPDSLAATARAVLEHPAALLVIAHD